MAHSPPKLRIPEQQRGAVRAFHEISAEATETLTKALAVAKPSASVAGLVRQIGSAVTIDPDALEGIVGMLLSLSASSTRYGIAIDQVASDVADRAVEEKLGPTPDSVDSFRTRLVQLLRLDHSIGVSSRLLNVMWESKNVFVSARIVSDIRSVFSADDPPVPIAAAIIHNLRIESHTDDKHTNFYFALDSANLRSLRDTIDRAFKKEESLRKGLRSAGLAFVDIGSDLGGLDA